jgi:antitoxin CcdA
MRMDHAHEPAESPIEPSGAGPEGERVELHQSIGAKRPTNLSVRADLIDAARRDRLNLSALLERALIEEFVRIKWRQWREENAGFVAAYNRHVREHGTFSVICLRL